MLSLSSRVWSRIKNSIVWGIVLMGISFGAGLFLRHFEVNAGNTQIDSISELAFWWIQTITGLGAPISLTTEIGRFIAVFIVFSGFVLLGLFVSDFSEIIRMVYSRKEQGNIKVHSSGHVVIFGYTSLTAGVIKTLRRHFGTGLKIVLISNDTDTNPFPGQVQFIHDNPIDDKTLIDSNVQNAVAAIILANDRFRDPDTYSLVIASGIEKHNSNVVTIAEVINAENRNFFKRVHIDAFVSKQELLQDLLEDSPNPKLKRIILKESVLEEDEDESVNKGLI